MHPLDKTDGFFVCFFVRLVFDCLVQMDSPVGVKHKHPGRCGAGREFNFPGWDAYNHSLDENPVTTKAFTSLTGWFLGDLVTQVGGGGVCVCVCLCRKAVSSHIISVRFGSVLSRLSLLEVHSMFIVRLFWHPLDSSSMALLDMSFMEV